MVVKIRLPHVLFVSLALLFLGGCVTYTKSESGKPRFWEALMTKINSPVSEESSIIESWEKSELNMRKFLSERINKGTKEGVLKYFPKPTSKRDSVSVTSSSAVAWYFSETSLIEGEFFIPFGQSSLQNGFILALGFDVRGILRSVETEQFHNPSSSWGVTSKNVMQAVITVLSYNLLTHKLEKAMDRAVDKADRKLTEHENTWEEKIKTSASKGVQDGVNSLSGKEFTISGSVNGQSFEGSGSVGLKNR